ncbi:hypothetical protein LCGC14_2501080 [marine sediment metagenome]|uniref:Uncharacterized protein n=1 Tax=marine sediment metagenome TaxID=412755 RepID=A0A0F9BPV4_9ZZZZ
MTKTKRTEWRVIVNIDYFNDALRFATEAEARTWVLNVIGPKPRPGTVTVEEVEAI